MTKVTQITNNLLRFAKNKFGLDIKALEIIYKGAILPIICYGVSVWAEALDHKFVTDPLNSLQRRFAIRMIRGYRTVSTDAANVIANLMPIDLWLKGRAVEYFVKKGIENEIFNKYFADSCVNNDNIQRPLEVRRIKHSGFQRKIPVIINNDINTNNSINAFCESVGISDGVGAGYMIYKDQRLVKQKKIKVSNNCTEFQAKILSVNMCLHYIADNIRTLNDIDIYLKNESVVNALQDYKSTNDLIFNIYEIFYKFLDKNININIIFSQLSESIEFQSVKTLAEEAIVSHNRIEYEMITKSRIKRLIYQKNVEEWNQRWIESNTGSQTKTFFGTIFDRLIVRKHFKTNFYLTQILTNHGKFNQYLKRFHLIDSPACDYCGYESQDANHKIYYCMKYQDKRNELIASVEANGHQWPITSKDLINEK